MPKPLSFIEPTLIGDGLENPANAATLLNVAAMFGGQCIFTNLKPSIRAELSALTEVVCRTLSSGEIPGTFRPLIAVENAPGARQLFGFRPPAGPRPALILGNERHGISQLLGSRADSTVEIPMFGHGPNTLNVGAAAAIAAYYISRPSGASMRQTANPGRRRPELLLMGPQDHVEIGSSLRSAGAFGWERVLLEDRASAWFGVERPRRNESRAAARRQRNPIRVIPVSDNARYAFDDVCVISLTAESRPITKVNLARGTRQLIVLPDEDSIEFAAEHWGRLGKVVHFIGLGFTPGEWRYQYRIVASIALAEIARQVGQTPRTIRAPAPRKPSYDSSLQLLDLEVGETIHLDELERY